jgi:hypothetical protein
VQYNADKKKKKYTGPNIPQSVTKRYGIDNFKPTIKDKLKSAVTKPAPSPVRSAATSPRPTRQTFNTAPSRNVGSVVPKKPLGIKKNAPKPGPRNPVTLPSTPRDLKNLPYGYGANKKRPGPIDDVVGPNRPPKDPLEIKTSAIKRRIRRVKGPVTTAAKNRKKYGGM